MTPTYKLTGESFDIIGRGIAYTAVVIGPCRRKDLKNLIGTIVNGQEIIDVESFAVESQANKTISLLVKQREV